MVNATVRQYRNHVPWPKHLALRSHGKPNAADIVEIEQQIGVGLPASFRDFITETGGGYVDDLLANVWFQLLSAKRISLNWVTLSYSSPT